MKILKEEKKVKDFLKRLERVKMIERGRESKEDGE